MLERFDLRSYRFKQWPYEPTINAIFANDRLLLSMIAALPRRYCPLPYISKEGPVLHDLIQGAVIRWHDTCYPLVDIRVL